MARRGQHARLLGADESLKVIRALGKSATRQVELRSLRYAARPVLRDMRQMAPRDTGKLSRSIVMRTLRERLATIGVGPLREVYYAHILEFGSRYMAPRPFMRPAVDKNEQLVKRRYGEQLGKEMIRAADKQTRPLRQSGLLSRRGITRRFRRRR